MSRVTPSKFFSFFIHILPNITCICVENIIGRLTIYKTGFQYILCMS